MYCNKCGKQIPDDSNFCPKCGNTIATNPQTGHSDENAEKQENKGCLLAILLIIVGIVFAFFVIKFIVDNSNNGGSLLETQITQNDYSVNTSQGLTTYTVTITPKTDIKTCTVEFKFMNSNGAVVYADTITKTNLNKGSSYSFTVELGVVGALQSSQVRYTVTGKK